MHILHWVATQASDRDEATTTVQNSLEEMLGGDSWYDWFVVGGGRWNDEQDDYTNSTNMVIESKTDEDKEAFRDRIAKCIEYRKESVAQYQKHEDFDWDEIVDRIKNWDGESIGYDYELNTAKMIIGIMIGNYSYDSYFLNIDTWDTNPKNTLKTIETEDDWYLVPVDFHF